ncbi:MAG: hypothetical protein AUJ92_10600 [Armatimonadetes bacterium CG2_30_59_28]|nr:recombinase family protein [Armatimonadota bacterium]OIO94206.1 MAG: hypothetical protein AUJ92_10600 [Armatimonadetes bacterium CG2_30_59_28]PIU61101.1 MAG: recombinase [Armatimonadetes bacterium CG07_land_8_20_14_0_80_59_28]PIX41953.1 MAG: recombinase [Armatimonadetes bacterium CG_4_8_14_3_um_filter_58_9]PIY49093.1 MAG: recombinase [Armatimonadetes bacterium CG_4_10_14_3_um_filter_59_10]PJB63166.1 MAG: recombinase [Armatimonadetes bacterium CG_4_9_14_3_um_filter_58_7]
MPRTRTRTNPSSDPHAVTEAVIYTRVSTSEQVDSGLGLEAQESRCRAYAEANGWTVAGVFSDAGVSASGIDRPALNAALQTLTRGRILVGLKLDRLTRNVSDLTPLVQRIEDAGAEWATVAEKFDTTFATGRLMLRLMLEISQWEREVIGERTSAALQEKKRRGERRGTLPLGFDVDEHGQIHDNREEQATVARARELREKEGLTLRQIAEVLTREGRQTKRGGKWGPETVNLLLKPRYLETIAESPNR